MTRLPWPPRSSPAILICAAWLVASSGRAIAEATGDLPWLDPQETLALLATLEDEGLVPTELDLAALGLPSLTAAASPTSRPDVGTRASGSCRVEFAGTGRARIAARYAAGPWQGQLRARGETREDPSVGGYLWLGTRSLDAAAGGVGASHGLGILAAAPGRGRSASATSSPLPGESGLRRWSSPDPNTGMVGLGSEWRHDAFVAGGLVGRTGQPEDPLPYRAGWLGWRRENLEFAAFRQVGPQPGLSLAARVRRGGLEWSAESASWRGSAANGGGKAVAASLSWRSARALLEVLAATAAAAGEPRLGGRPACLIGWDGRGWVVRGRAKLTPTTTAAVLVAAAEDRPSRTVSRDRALRHVLELSAVGSWGEGRRWELRWRRREEERWTHSDTAPWRPAQPASCDLSTIAVAAASRPLATGVLQAALRAATRSSPASAGTRTLASLNWRHAWPAVRVTCGGAWAWGDPVALSTVVAPFADLAVPRSWGAWAGEVFAGCDLRWRAWRGQLAAARRVGAGEKAGLETWEIWFAAAAGW